MKPPWDAILWWELRRIPFNLAVGLAGVIAIVAIFGIGGQMVTPGEDAVEPTLLLVGTAAYGLAANVLYTIGWASEWLWSGGGTARTAPFRQRIFRLGLALSVALTLLPAVLLLTLWTVVGVS